MSTNEILRYFPEYINQQLSPFLDVTQEIRLTIGQAVMVYTGKIVILEQLSVTRDILNNIISKMTGGALYSVQDKITKGFFTLQGGHRVGVCGRAAMDGDTLKSITDISSINLRIARCVQGCANSIFKNVWDGKTVKNTIILGRPGSGKTTLIRDISRLLASNPINMRVGIIDERSEICAAHQGVISLNTGTTSFVLDACAKTNGMSIMLRSMSPDVVVFDEIGDEQEAEAVRELFQCGVTIICTAHSRNIQSTKKRKSIAKLIDEVFETVIYINAHNKYEVIGQ